MYKVKQMRTQMKHQLTLFTILFILMGCNNSPNAQQVTNQATDNSESTTPSITEDASEQMRINDDILAIEQKISDLEQEEKNRISQEIKLIQQKIANLETQETEIDSAISKLEAKIMPSTTTTTPSVAATESIIEENLTQADTQTTKPQQIVSLNPKSVHSWGDWANGVKPAAGPGAVAVARFDVQKPNVNFRPNENSAFYRSTITNLIPAAVLTAEEITNLTNAISNETNVVIPPTPSNPVSTTGPSTGGF